jgi:hypothetical protein
VYWTERTVVDLIRVLTRPGGGIVTAPPARIEVDVPLGRLEHDQRHIDPWIAVVQGPEPAL